MNYKFYRMSIKIFMFRLSPLLLLLPLFCKNISHEKEWMPFYRYSWCKNAVCVDSLPKLSPTETRNLINVLLFYKINFKVNSEQIYIPSEIAVDTMLMFSLSRKSLDVSWQKEHPLE